MNAEPYKILFLCTGNSARSIMAEYFTRQLAPQRFESYSAGAKPTGVVNPLVLRVLKESFNIDASDARSKSWEEFNDFTFDFIITVCDRAKENCPIWPGQPIMAHWGLPDPAAFAGTEAEKLEQTLQVARQIRRRLELFNVMCSVPLETMERMKLEYAVKEIGKSGTVTL
jgi:protein-tyrosine-phosphatase